MIAQAQAIDEREEQRGRELLFSPEAKSQKAQEAEEETMEGGGLCNGGLVPEGIREGGKEGPYGRPEKRALGVAFPNSPKEENTAQGSEESGHEVDPIGDGAKRQIGEGLAQKGIKRMARRVSNAQTISDGD